MEKQRHWGDWIDARSRYVGFRRQSDLAEAVGCNRERIVAWVSMNEPPKQMHKGFDKKLAFALETTQSMLFSEWRHNAPERVERKIFHPDQFPLEMIEAANTEFMDTFLRLVAQLNSLELERAIRFVAGLLAIRAGPHEPAVRMLWERFHQLNSFGKTGEQPPAQPFKEVPDLGKRDVSPKKLIEKPPPKTKLVTPPYADKNQPTRSRRSLE